MKKLILILMLFPLLIFGQSKIRNTQITSGNASAKKVLTSDGATNAIWDSVRVSGLVGDVPLFTKTDSTTTVSVNLGDTIYIPDVTVYKLKSDSTAATGYTRRDRLASELSKKIAKVTSTDNAVVRFDGTTGVVQNSGVTVDDSNNINIPTSSEYKINGGSIVIDAINDGVTTTAPSQNAVFDALEGKQNTLTNPVTGNATPFAANALIKATGTGNQVAASGVTVDGSNNLNLPLGSQYRINGTQISSADLSNDANITKYDAATKTFTGTGLTSFAGNIALSDKYISLLSGGLGRINFTNGTNLNTTSGGTYYYSAAHFVSGINPSGTTLPAGTNSLTGIIFGTRTNDIQIQFAAGSNNGEFYKRISSAVNTFETWKKFFHEGNSNLATVDWNANNITAAGTIQATTAKLTNLTNGYLPYHISDASGLGNSGAYWNGTELIVGNTTYYSSTGGHSKVSNWSNDGIFAGYSAGQFENSINGVSNYILKSRGTTIGSHGLVLNNDAISFTGYEASDGVAWKRGAVNRVSVDGAASLNIVPMRFTWETMNSAGTLAERMRLASSGNLLINTTTDDGINKIQVNGSIKSSGLTLTNLTGTGTRLSTVSSTGVVGVLANGSEGYIPKIVSGAITWVASSVSEVYRGTWSAATNTPTLANGTGTAGDYYICSAAGTVNFGAGNITFAVGDRVSYNGSIWQFIQGVGYNLQAATASVLGGVKIGSGVSVTGDGTISVSTAYDASGTAASTMVVHESTYNHANYNTAYTDRFKWDGGSTGLDASTGRTSLGLVIGTDVLAYRTFGTAANNNTGDFEVPLTFSTGLNRTGNTVTSTITQYTDALARGAVSFTAGSGAYNALTGVFSIPTNTNQLTNGAGYITDGNTGWDNTYGFITGYTETDPTIYSWAKASTKPTYTYSEVGAEAALGNPAANGYVLSSTAAGVRSWVAPSSGADGNNYPTSLAFNIGNGIVTLGRSGLSDLTVDLDGRYLISETDPTYTASTWYSTANNSTNWNTAYTNMGKVSITGGSLFGTLSATYFNDVVGGEITLKRAGSAEAGNFLPITSGGVYNELLNKQATLVSGTNIKTFGGASLLGSGEIVYGTPSNGNVLTYDSTYKLTWATPTSGADGNNYTNSISFSGETLSLGREGLSTLSATGIQAKLVSGTNIKTVNSVSVVGSGNATITANTPNSATFNSSGAGAASGSTFNGGSAVTVSYNTIGAAALAGSTSQAFSVQSLTFPNSCSINSNSSIFRFLNGANNMYLESNGNLTTSGTMTATNFVLSSDFRLKNNIKPIDFSNVKNINFVQFNYKADSTIRTRYGVIAQEVEKNAPELIYTDMNGMKQVAYIDLLIAKLAELEARIKQLEDEKNSK